MYKEIPKFSPDEILVYLRRSRSDDPSLSVEEVLEKHETILREWIERNLDGPIPPENWYREVVSGETIAGRPEMIKVLTKVEAQNIKAVLCVECSRLSRGDLEDCGRLIKLLRYTNTLVITPQRMYDLQDEFDREGFEREIKHGNFYLEYSKKIMKRGLDVLVKAGCFVGSVAPYGYRKVRVLVGKKKLPTLEIAEEEAKVVRMIFDWYLNEDIGARRIAVRLDEMGIQPPKKSEAWCSMTIRKILENEHYLGKIRYYAHKMDHQVVNQEVIKKKVAVKDYQLFDGMHDAIIDDETFYKAKAKRDSFPRIKKSSKLRNPLATMLYCECGYAMSFTHKRGIARFECPEQRRCNNSSIDAKQLMDMISDSLKQNLEDFSVEIGGSNEDIYERHQEKIRFLEQKLKDIEYRELSLWEKYTEDKMPKNVFDNLRKKYEQEKESTEALLKSAINDMPERIDYEKQIATFHEAIEGMADDSISAEAKNNLLRACIKKISYSRPGAVRGPIEDVKEGQSYEKGWIQSAPHIDITLKI